MTAAVLTLPDTRVSRPERLRNKVTALLTVAGSESERLSYVREHVLAAAAWARGQGDDPDAASRRVDDLLRTAWQDLLLTADALLLAPAPTDTARPVTPIGGHP